MVNIAVMGYGTVGSGVVEVLNLNHSVITQRAGDAINVKYVLDLRDFPGDPIQEKIIHDFETIVNDPEIRIVVEVMGGIEPAYTFVKRCLEAARVWLHPTKRLLQNTGRSFCPSRERGTSISSSRPAWAAGSRSSVPLNSSMTADVIEEITGILNGTTNYMLTKMFYEGADYDEVLKEAQDKGYAERNPEAMWKAMTACRKIAILSSLISGQQVDIEDIYTEGITKVSRKDMMYAKKMGNDHQTSGVQQTPWKSSPCDRVSGTSRKRASAVQCGRRVQRGLCPEAMCSETPCSMEAEQESSLLPVQLWLMSWMRSNISTGIS